jgi:SAM-dependent methyltransferase
VTLSWDDRYAGDEYHFGTEPNAFLVACAPLLVPGDRALLVADGEGRNGVWVAAQGLRVDAFDASPVAVAKARRLATARGVEVTFDEADADGWAWSEAAYDVVAAIFIQFASPALRRRIYARVAAALRPGGVFLLEGYTPAQLGHGTGGPRVLEQLYTPAQLREELGAVGLVIERLEAYETVLEEGPGHSGRSAVIDVVARRPAV